MKTFSVLHATLNRPEKAVAAMRMWLDRAANPSQVEYIFACNADDPSFSRILELGGKVPARYELGPFKGSAAAWDAAAKVSTGEVLIQGQDDVEPPEGWDVALHERMEREMALATLEFASGERRTYSVNPAFIAVSDGFRKDRLCCTAIMNRARYEQQGEFLHAGYLSVFSDDEVTYRAYRDQRDGKCTVIEACDLVFLHRHHYHDKSIPFDSTYEKENSQEAYQFGRQLFTARNPFACCDGVRDWR